MLAIAATGCWFIFRRSKRSYTRAERERIVDMAEEPNAVSYGSPYYDGPDTSACAPDPYPSGSLCPNSSGAVAYISQPVFSAERDNQAVGVAAAGNSAPPLFTPSRLAKAQEAGLAPRDAEFSTLSSHNAVVTDRQESHTSLNEPPPPPPPPPPKSVRRESLTSSAANTTLTASETSTEAFAGLRQEVQDLRRIMQRLHGEQLEAPPQYDE